MIIKIEYSSYFQRLYKNVLWVLFLSIILTMLLLLSGISREGIVVAILVVWAISLIITILTIKKSKRYLTEIKIQDEQCEFTIYEFDQPEEIVKTKLSETRIKIWELFFPFTSRGRNYKLIIETNQGLTYKPIIQQYEIGNWNLNKFREVMDLYCETKGVTVSNESYKRSNF